MLYRADQPAAIRNAQTATGNGRASVASPCGGANTFGSNGIGTMKDGDTITLDMRYAAGHNGAFRMAYACNGENTLSGDELEADAATLTATASMLLPTLKSISLTMPPLSIARSPAALGLLAR